MDSNSVVPVSLSELLVRAGLAASITIQQGERLIRDVTGDSREVCPGGCFIAHRGTGRDGHDFVSAAVDRGATAVVVEREIKVPDHIAVIRVPDGRVALAKLAAAFHLRSTAGDNDGLRLIGVTGTNGKSTVTWILRSILQAAGESAALLGTIEYDLIGERRKAALTTPGAVELCRALALARRSGATCAAMEVSSHALDQHRCDGLRFDAGVFTNLSGDHLDYHGTMAAYLKAKRKLFDLLSPTGMAVINADDDAGRTLANDLSGRVITFGLASTCDVWADAIRMGRSGSEFSMCSRDWKRNVRLPLVGKHNVSNALAAAAAADALGVSPDAIVAGLERVTNVPGRLQRVEPDGWPFSVFVDYAHTDAALENVLTTLRPLTASRLLCVFGCGGDRDRTKRPRMAAAVGKHADVAFVTSDNPRSEEPDAIIRQILPGFGHAPRCRVEVEADRRRAIRAAIGEARTGDTVLIAGKGHEDYQIIGKTVLPFDDVAVASEFLAALSPRLKSDGPTRKTTADTAVAHASLADTTLVPADQERGRAREVVR